MNRWLTCAVMLLIFSCSYASAGSGGDPCQDAHDQREMTACWGTAARDAESRVDDLVGKLNARLAEIQRDDAAELLRSIQNEWGRYRDAECNLAQMRWEGGSGANMAKAVCRNRLASERANRLEDDLEEWSR